MTNSRLTAYVMLLGTTIIWGVAIPVIKFTLHDFPPILFLTYRFFLTSAILLPILVLTNQQALPRSRNIWLIILIGLLGSSINLGLLFWGITYTTAISASVLGATSPILIVLAGSFFLKEHITNSEKTGLIIAFLGSLALAVSPSVVNHQSGTLGGNFLIMLSNLTWVAYVILSKMTLKQAVSPLFLVTSSFVLGFLSLFPLALLTTGSLADLVNEVVEQPFMSHIGVWYMALFSGALAYFLYQEGQRRIEASEATIFYYLTPIFGVPLSILWLGEKITLPFILGSLIIVIGVFITEYKRRKR